MLIKAFKNEKRIYCKKINDNIIPDAIPKTSASNPTGKACFHLVIPTLVKYKLKT